MFESSWRFPSAAVGTTLALVQLLCSSTAAAADPPSLSDYLAADGQLQLPTDFVGALNPAGFDSVQTINGQLRFFRSEQGDASKLFGASGGCDGGVRALAVGADGTVYLGGGFSYCGQIEASGVAAYDPGTREFTALGAPGAEGVDGYVVTMTVAGSSLYIGGAFRAAGGTPANHIARWDGQSWSPLGSGLSAQVNAIEVQGNDVYAGGLFVSSASTLVSRVARWDGTGWNPLGAGVNGTVNDLLWFEDKLIVGGRFSEVGGAIATAGLAQWDGVAWSSLGQFAPSNGPVEVLSLSSRGDELYVGGRFGGVDEVQAQGVVRRSGAQWSAIPDVPYAGSEGVARRVFVSGDRLYALLVSVLAGERVSSISSWDGDAWESLGGPANGSDPFDLQVVDGEAYVAGFFTTFDGQPIRNVARLRGAWEALGDPGGSGIDGEIRAIAAIGEQLYLGGEFFTAGGQVVNHIVRWNGASWSALAGPGGVGLNGAVWALSAVDGMLYVGGGFTVAGGLESSGIVRWDGEGWLPLATGAEEAPGVYTNTSGGSVYSLASDGAGVYVGGSFSRAGSTAASSIAYWNGSSWSALGSPEVNGIDGLVYAMDVVGSGLYVGGFFSSAGGVSATNIALWDGQRWSALATGLRGSVRALDAQNGILYAGGRFDATGDGAPAHGIAAWNGAEWRALGDGDSNGVGDPSSLHTVYTLIARNTILYVGGFFNSAGGQSANGMAVWDGEEWWGLGLRAQPQQVKALAVQDNPFVLVTGASLAQSQLPELQSRTHAGEPAGGVGVEPVELSQFGSKIVYSTTSSAFESEPDEQRDIFIRDRISGDVVHITAPGSGVPDDPELHFNRPSLSADGDTVAFSDIQGRLYVAQRGKVKLLSASASGQPANSIARAPKVLGYGSLVLFDTDATNLVPGLNGSTGRRNVYIKNVQSGEIRLVSYTVDGLAANGDSFSAAASADGRRVVFSTYATNLAEEPVAIPGPDPQLVLVIDDEFGRRVQYLGSTGAVAELTPDGRYGVFTTRENGLGGAGFYDADSNNSVDVFRFEIENRSITELVHVSLPLEGKVSRSNSDRPSISDDGQTIVFDNFGVDLVALDGNQGDILVKSMRTGQLLRVARGVDGNQPNGNSLRPHLSGDGSTVAFVSIADNLAAGDSPETLDAFTVQLGAQSPNAAIGPMAEPSLSAFQLPTPLPANPNCPAGYYAALVDDGPAAGIHSGSFGMELLLDESGDRLLQGGLNFGGLIDRSQPGFAGFNIANPSAEAQRVTLMLTGNPWTDEQGSLPVLLRVARRDESGVEVVFESTISVTLAQAFESALELTPGYYETSVSVLDGEIGGAPEGQFYFAVNTSFLDRPGGGFQGGAVVGGYHGEPRADSVSGFAAFCLATPHSVSARVLSAPSYGPLGAEDLRLRIHEAAERRDLMVVPSG